MLRGALCAAGSDKRPVHRPALPYLHEFVVVDTPTAMSYVNPSNLADWGVTQGQVFDAARANLTAMASLPPGTASPDDPNLVRYWADRRCRNRSPLDNATLRLLQA